MFDNIKTPCYVIDKAKLIRNLKVLQGLEKRTGCKILLAQKAFSMYRLYPLIGEYISGTVASGLYEARLGYTEMAGKETHVFSPAYTQNDFNELVNICSHIIFNSYEQYVKYKNSIPSNINAGLRINPEHSTQDRAIYDPCAPYSRLGTTLANIKDKDLSGIEGLHFHTLCEQNSDALAETLDVVIKKFSYLFPRLKWINFGGGHHITREDYDIDLLEKCIKRIQNYGLKVYLEPGEAVALNAGYLISEVIDVIHNRIDIAILDTSAACHMPDIIEMPYQPNIVGAKQGAGTHKDGYIHHYQFGGNTCLAGDIIGRYSFNAPLSAGDRLVFEDMAIYTMVKNNTFNGVPLPNIAIIHENGEIEMVKEFGYEDFKGRL